MVWLKPHLLILVVTSWHFLESQAIIVPEVWVHITDLRGVPPVVGENYTLVCNISHTGIYTNTSADISYQWMKGNTKLIQTGNHSDILSLSPFRFSYAGQYICQATVYLSLRNGTTIILRNTDSYNVISEIPSSIMVHSNKSNPIRPIGSDVTLTCSVELQSEIDVPVTVNIEWMGPAGAFSSIELVMEKHSTVYTSTTTVSSFQRHQSGNYTCTANVNSTFLVLSDNRSTIMVTVGVYLSLRGYYLFNNSVIFINEIGESPAYNRTIKNGLQCVTDWELCCRRPYNVSGQWFFPNGDMVPVRGYNVGFYRNRGYDGTVNLNRHKTTITSPTGLFCCTVPNAQGKNQMLCANIVPTISIEIMDRGASPMPEKSYSLQCKVSGPGITNTTVNYHWIKNCSNSTLSQNGMNSSILSFSYFRLSDAGNYTCQATASSSYYDYSNVNITTSWNIITQIPSPSLVLLNTDNSLVPSGSHIILTCIVEMSPAVDIPVTVNIVLLTPNGSVLTNSTQQVMEKLVTSRTRIYLSSTEHSGVYKCITFTMSTSPLLSDSNFTTNITRITIYTSPSTNPEEFTAMPASMTVQFSWSPPYQLNGTVTVVSNYTLICTSRVVQVDSVRASYVKAGSYTLGGFRPSTEYNCSIYASNPVGRGPSASINVMTMDEISSFQLQLIGVNCLQWVIQGTNSKLDTIAATVLNKIEKSCLCGFIRDRITDEVFRCFPASPHAVTYRAIIHGTAGATSTQLISYIEQWTAKGATVIIDQILLGVNASCSVAIISISTNEECPKAISVSSVSVVFKPTDTDVGVTAIIGGSTVAVIVVIVTASAVVIILALVLKNHHADKNNQQPRELCARASEQPLVTMSNVAQGDEIYNMVDTDHEYEGLDKYSKRDGEIKPTPLKGLDSIQKAQKSVIKEYECTDCIAYMPVTVQQGGNAASAIIINDQQGDDIVKEEENCT